MKKVLAIFVITILYLLPLMAFAQRRNFEQTKLGEYSADVTYDAVNEFTQTNYEGSNYKSLNRHYISKFHVQFHSSQRVKVMRHDNTTSIVELLETKGKGAFSYIHSGEEQHVSTDDLQYNSTEEANFNGMISEAGTISGDFPERGDVMETAQASAKGKGNGFYKKIINQENWVYNPQTGQNSKKNAEPEIDNRCQSGGYGPTFLELNGEADVTRPPETACAAEFATSFQVMTRAASPEELKHRGAWGAAAFEGSFVSGKYKVSLMMTNKPDEYNTEIQNGKNVFTETLTFMVTLTLAGATAEIFSADKNLNSDILAEALMPDDKLRFLARKS